MAIAPFPSLISLITRHGIGEPAMAGTVGAVSSEKKEIVQNLYASGIPEEFIAMQLDLEIPVVIAILQESGIYHHANEP
jgi:ribosomal protein S12 methylthiotransferase accessory factor YcaO